MVITMVFSLPPRPLRMRTHYHSLRSAYIKSLKTGKWYSFNDMHVTLITEADVRKTFGDEEKRMSAANAYLLMYRKMEPGTEGRSCLLLVFIFFLII